MWPCCSLKSHHHINFIVKSMRFLFRIFFPEASNSYHVLKIYGPQQFWVGSQARVNMTITPQNCIVEIKQHPTVKIDSTSYMMVDQFCAKAYLSVDGMNIQFSKVSWVERCMTFTLLDATRHIQYLT